MTLLYQTGIKGTERVIGKIKELENEDWTSKDSGKKFYRVWLSINEETFHDLFVSAQFTEMLHHVTTKGLLFRKSYDDFFEKILKNTPLPNRRDMDEVYKSLYDLRKELRAIKKEMAKLQASITVAHSETTSDSNGQNGRGL
jgi:hypothetical protein